ncbi:MAG TPA: hypothetical protein VIJ22_17850 [Polyangiaceae bacterium]
MLSTKSFGGFSQVPESPPLELPLLLPLLLPLDEPLELPLLLPLLLPLELLPESCPPVPPSDVAPIPELLLLQATRSAVPPTRARLAPPTNRTILA